MKKLLIRNKSGSNAEDRRMSEVKEKILIVDDNITDKEELKKILEDEYEMLEAGNDELVIQLLEDNLGSIALVIINLEMQGMDGSGLLELLKGRNRFANPVVMIITSQTEAEKERWLPYEMSVLRW